MIRHTKVESVSCVIISVLFDCSLGTVWHNAVSQSCISCKCYLRLSEF